MAEDIDFKYPVKRSCTAEITKFCSGIPHGHAQVIRCLQDNMESEDMSGECREEVTRDQIRSSQDYRYPPSFHPNFFGPAVGRGWPLTGSSSLKAICASELPVTYMQGYMQSSKHEPNMYCF